jgi:hypothetical protein
MGTRENYQEFARKMALFEDGPTTTRFEQLSTAGVELRDPDAVADVDVRAKLWQVLAGLATFRTYLDETDHLGDRELYAALWRDVLREDVPAIDEIGFDHYVNLLSNGGEEETFLYLKYFADDEWRQQWMRDFPDYVLPTSVDPPYNRDCLLPRPGHERGSEAREWLRANWSGSALASNRFQDTAQALAFVEQLYGAGAQEVRVDHVMFLHNDRWAPYADALIVDLPTHDARRSGLFELIEGTGRPDEHDRLGPLRDSGQKSVRLWWD